MRCGAVDLDSEAQTTADAAARLSRQRFEVTPPAALSTAGTEPVRCKQAAAELGLALPLPASGQLNWHARRSSVQHAGSWLACHSCNPAAIHKCCHLDLAEGLRCAAGHVCVCWVLPRLTALQLAAPAAAPHPHSHSPPHTPVTRPSNTGSLPSRCAGVRLSSLSCCCTSAVARRLLALDTCEHRAGGGPARLKAADGLAGAPRAFLASELRKGVTRLASSGTHLLSRSAGRVCLCVAAAALASDLFERVHQGWPTGTI